MSGPSPAIPLRVVSYNVRGLRAGAPAVARVLRDLDADVVLLQEIPRLLNWRGRCAALARRADLLYAGGGGTTGGTALFTSIRVDVREVEEHRLRPTPGLRRRGLVLARLAKDGVPFGAASIHLGDDAGERARHLTDITALVNRFGLASMVVGGDVNEEPGAPTWTRLASHYADAGAAVSAPTFPVTDPRRRTDGVFVRGPVAVESYWVADTAQVRKASDHRPVVADLTLTP